MGWRAAGAKSGKLSRRGPRPLSLKGWRVHTETGGRLEGLHRQSGRGVAPHLLQRDLRVGWIHFDEPGVSSG